MTCLICGTSWAVQGLGTCRHMFCSNCLRTSVEEQLLHQRTTWQLNLRCPAPECVQVVPNSVALEASPAVQQTLRELEPACPTLKFRLSLARLKRQPELYPLIAWGPRPSEAGPQCPKCNMQQPGLLANPDCGHVACESCWSDWVEEQIPHCRAEKRSCHMCIGTNCKKSISQVLIRHLSAYSTPISSFVEELKLEVARFQVEDSTLVWAAAPSDSGPVCSICETQHLALFANSECGHAACEDCWAKWAEVQVPNCRQERKLRPSCMGHGCCHPMSSGIWQHARTRSQIVRMFAAEMDSEVSRLMHTASQTISWAPLPSEPGLECPVCHERHLALFANTDCGHDACEDCWTKWAAEQVPSCRTERKLWPTCFDPNCHHPMARGIWQHAQTMSQTVSEYGVCMDSEVARLTRTADDILSWAPLPSDAGPECFVCRERHLALLENPECGHSACEQCWSTWAEVQLPQCRAQRQASFRCIGAHCQIAAVAPVWSHTCTLSDTVRRLDSTLAFRRRLQSNALYPPEVQVECTQGDCLGLGYLGSDTVMCFMCEHQWAADTVEHPPCTIDDDCETIAGEVVKKCPGCGQRIVKNGGCDHMSCRCGHQFWWSTLTPYPGGQH